jgi:hypothetical protein
MAKQKPLTDVRRDALMEGLVRLTSNADMSQVELAALLRLWLGRMLYNDIDNNFQIEARAASDPVVLAMVAEALRRGGVLG